jgi:hypothetical protein
VKLGLIAVDLVCNPIDRRVYMSGLDDSCVYVIRDELVGVAEPPRPASRSPEFRIWPNPARDCLHVGGAEGQSGDARARPIGLFAATGRKVAELVSGANDIRQLSPGVYFVRERNSGGRSPGNAAGRKIVITR